MFRETAFAPRNATLTPRSRAAVTCAPILVDQHSSCSRLTNPAGLVPQARILLKIDVGRIGPRQTSTLLPGRRPGARLTESRSTHPRPQAGRTSPHGAVAEVVTTTRPVLR